MAATKSAWGIEVGAFAIKAVRLERQGDEIRVADFVVIPHRKVLTTPDLQQDEMIRIGLGQLISEKDLRNQTIVMSVPGHLAFARFAKLPPVEPKKIPDIVRFEAVQQIPFPIEDVEWDYQTFGGGDSPEVEVGIFAITKERLAHLFGIVGRTGHRAADGHTQPGRGLQRRPVRPRHARADRAAGDPRHRHDCERSDRRGAGQGAGSERSRSAEPTSPRRSPKRSRCRIPRRRS